MSALRRAAEAVVTAVRQDVERGSGLFSDIQLLDLEAALYAPDELAEAREIMRRAKATCSPATGDRIDDWLSRNKEPTDAE